MSVNKKNMTREDDGRMELPRFIEVPILLHYNDNGDNSTFRAKAKLNPSHISSYYPILWNEQVDGNTEKIEAVSVTVGSERHCVELTMKQFDELIENSDRSMSFSVVSQEID